MQDPINKSNPENPVGRFMVALGAVIELNTSGNILLIQRDDHLDWHPSEWEINYGRIAQFEDIEGGLKREIYEELGVENLTIICVLRAWHLFRGSEIAENELIGITYYCRIGNQQINLSKEHSHYQWVLPRKALQIIKNEGIKKDIEKFIEVSNKGLF